MVPARPDSTLPDSTRPDARSLRRPLVAWLTAALVGLTAPFAAFAQEGAPVTDDDAAAERAAAVEELAFQVNRLGLAVWGQVRGEAGNLAVAPLSVASLFAAVAEGGGGRAASDAAHAAKFGMAGERLRAAFAGLRAQSAGDRKGALLLGADALWLAPGGAPPSDFAAAAEAALGLHVAVREGADGVAQSRGIGAWTDGRTDGAIDVVARPDELSGGVVWTGATDLSGGWARPFPTDATTRGPFHTADGREVTVGFMQQVGPFGYARVDGVRLVELMYATGAVSLVVVMPEGAGRLDAVEKKLTPDRLERWIQEVRVQDLRLVLPRFRVATRLRLDKALQKLGLQKAFGKRCDLGGIAPGGACLAAAVQVARVEVRETEPDAEEKSLPPATRGELPPLDFRADRPFLYFVRHNATGAILLIGRLSDPRA